MSRIITLLFFLAIINTQAQNFSILLSRPTNTSITVSVLFDQQVDFYLEYGVQAGAYIGITNAVTNTGGPPDEVDINGLVPDTKYYYRMQYRLSGNGSFTPTAEYTFHTQRSPGSTFTFDIEADEHLYDKKGVDNMYKVTLSNEAKDHPDFLISLGDIFGDDHTPLTSTSEQFDSLHKAYRPFLGSICHSIPLYICLGNHEGEKRYYLINNPPDNIAVWGTLWRKFYFPNPYPGAFYSGDTTYESFGMGYPENYYAWTWGDALFVVMDVYRYDNDTTAKPTNWAWTIGDQQYAWLKNTLESSTSKYKFVFAHHTRGEGRGGIATAKMFEWGGYQDTAGTRYTFPTYRPNWAKPIHQLFVDNGVNIFFQGHDHLFAHEILDNVTYQEVPMPSDSTYRLGIIANGDAYTADTVDGTGHVRVTVSPECVQVDYIKAYLPADTSGIHKNGEIGFSYAVGTCSPSAVVTRQAEDIRIFPNPTKDKATVLLPSSSTNALISITGLLGNVIIQSHNTELDLSNLPAGVYCISVKSDSYILNKYIVVIK